jgi:spermidine/putrescine transport system substrate-binding protein
LTNLIRSGTPNIGAIDYIKLELKLMKTILPDQQTLSRLEMLQALNHKQRRMLSRIWTEIKLR